MRRDHVVVLELAELDDLVREPAAAVSWVAASVAGYLATQVEGVGVWLLAAIAMVAITIAWVVSWMVVESTMLDRRLGARRAAAYDLLSRARLEVTIDRS